MHAFLENTDEAVVLDVAALQPPKKVIRGHQRQRRQKVIAASAEIAGMRHQKLTLERKKSKRRKGSNGAARRHSLVAENTRAWYKAEKLSRRAAMI